MSPENIINVACNALKLDSVTLISGDNAIYKSTKDQRRVRSNYRDCKLICIYLMRKKLIINKAIFSTDTTGKRVWVDADVPISYREIACVFKRKSPQTIMACEIKFKDLVSIDKEFKAKYEMVVSAMEQNVNIA